MNKEIVSSTGDRHIDTAITLMGLHIASGKPHEHMSTNLRQSIESAAYALKDSYGEAIGYIYQKARQILDSAPSLGEVKK